MEVRLASQAAPDRPVNEDYGFALPRLVGVFDGVTVPPGLNTGCIHGPGWYVRRLATHLTRRYIQAPDDPLPELLAGAIEEVRSDHEPSCDLSHPATPAATVSLLRETANAVEYLVLCDSPLVIDRGAGVQVVTDGRHAAAVAHLRAEALDGTVSIGSQDHAERVRQVLTKQQEYTNKPGGYWIAAANPQAAYEAVTSSLPLDGPDRVRRAALLTDGASCAVDRFNLFDWQGLLDILTDHGPRTLINRVRAAELADHDGYAQPRYKPYDDVTAAICLFDGE